ncbi:MAG: type II toxin-antitoxin system death-on-curing family toxin [Fimbriimonas sp.]|nr:type II toxin-antitoxin system death-on-curing family toxin [Fimbriimonas sp.]
MTKEPVWVHGGTVRHIQRFQIAAFGGLEGIRDEGMLESALARPVHLWFYERAPIFLLAAAYAFGIAMNHPFLDGNKRTALVISVLFVEVNGYMFTADEVDAATTFFSIAAGDIGEGEMTEWFEKWSIPR